LIEFFHQPKKNAPNKIVDDSGNQAQNFFVTESRFSVKEYRI